MKHALALVALAALALTGCTQAEPAPRPAPAEVVDPAPAADTFTEQDAEEFADAVCTVLDANGVRAGVQQMFAIAVDNGIAHEQISPLLAAAIAARCPEYEPLIALEAAGL